MNGDSATSAEAVLLDLGLREYAEVLRLQQDLVAARQTGAITDTLVLVEHPEVITLGRSAKPENVLDPGNLPVVTVERGGDVTYHGPGQLVVYPIFYLRENERDLHRYLRSLEEVVVRTLGEFGLVGRRFPGHTGVWTGPANAPRKLASIGVAIRKWVTLHGLALNVSADLPRFATINPCGLPAAVMTSMVQELKRPVDFTLVKQTLAWHLGAVFQRKWRETVDSR